MARARDLRLNPPIPALHPERDALLAAVRDADPADDLPALVYADWQDEHGQPEHAELIRVMVELPNARKQTPEAKARKKLLLDRTKELFKTPPLKPLREMSSSAWGFERGFVTSPTIYWSEQPHDAPFAGRMFLGPPSRIDVTAFVPFDKITRLAIHLGLGQRVTVELSAALAEQKWLRRVDELVSYPSGLNDYHAGPGTLRPLARCENLSGLREFRLGAGTIDAGELIHLLLAKAAINLRTFPLSNFADAVTTPNTRRTSRKAFLSAVEQIVSSKKATQFTSFGEDIVEVSEALAKILLTSPHLKIIREFQYVFEKTTPKTRAAFVERFGPPERID